MRIKNHTYKDDCKLFDGYKPCKYKREDCKECPYYQPIKKMILIINLDALGNVLMTTAALKPIKRKYPKSKIIWVTEKSAIPILQNNPLIDKVMPFNFETYLTLKNLKFDIIYNVDKSARAASLAMELNSKIKKGFKVNRFGAIVPFDKSANYNYFLGLNDRVKFIENKKTGQQILAETLDLDYQRDEYILNLSDEQKEFVDKYKKDNNIKENDIVVGFNTGCSELYPNKKLGIEHIIKLIELIHRDFPNIKIALFGGKAENERNKKIADSFEFNIINTPTNLGIEYGIAVMDIADIIVTGDTFGMHIGIGLKKRMVVWFNVSCAQEIDLYNRGEKIVSDVECSPCWKRSCDSLICLKNIRLDLIYDAIKKEIKNINNKT